MSLKLKIMNYQLCLNNYIYFIILYPIKSHMGIGTIQILPLKNHFSILIFPMRVFLYIDMNHAITKELCY